MQLISSCLDALERFMLQKLPVGLSVVMISNESKPANSSERTAVEAVAHILCIKDIGKLKEVLLCW